MEHLWNGNAAESYILGCDGFAVQEGKDEGEANLRI